MNTDSNEYMYTGEFGFFNILILPFLENYDGNKIKIYTFPDYCYIINKLFPDKFDCVEINLHKIRIGHTSVERTLKEQSFKERTLKEQSFKERAYNIKPLSIWINNISIHNIRDYIYLTKQITCDYNEEINNFICYFPRFRDSKNIPTDFKHRNSNKNECMTILNTFNKKYKIIIVGNELLDFDYKSFSNVMLSDSLEKTIFYLKKCKFLISNDSGFVDFAKNCGVKKVLILRMFVNYHLRFNPFNTTTINITDVNQLNTFL
jgi:hypothetical protein